MERDEALTLLRSHVHKENLYKHCLASEAVMRALARRLGEDEHKWATAGLLHDLDAEETDDAPARHGPRAAAVLRDAGLNEESVRAILAHNAEALDMERSTRFEHALASAETITGLIVATALVYPDRKIAGVKPKSVLKRMKKKDFARNVNRDIIRECKELGLELDAFVRLSLDAMKSIADDLGL